MKAVMFDAYGGSERLRIGQIEKPVPGKNEVLIRVAAAGTNPADVKWRAGMFANFVPLTDLRRLAGVEEVILLKLLDLTFVGRHYRDVLAASVAVILGGGCCGKSSLS